MPYEMLTSLTSRLYLSWDDDGSALLHLVAVMHERNVYM